MLNDFKFEIKKMILIKAAQKVEKYILNQNALIKI